MKALIRHGMAHAQGMPGLVVAWMVWMGLDFLDVQIACSTGRYRLLVDVDGLTRVLPWVRWVVGSAGVVMAVLHYRVRPEDSQRTLGATTYTLLTVVLLRALILWDPIGLVLPWLSLLWSPHAGWSVSILLFVLGSRSFVERIRLPRRLPVPAILFVCFATLYGVYAIYFCKLTTVHGDEVQYLWITQSLVNDGDIDLASDFVEGEPGEFQRGYAAPMKAPGSPPGRFHAIHPVGIAALLTPAYSWGRFLFGNPRLGSSLAIALMAAGILALGFGWLTRLGFRRLSSAITVVLVGLTYPFYGYSNQIFPEIPGLFILMVFLYATTPWQRGEFDRPMERGREPLALAAIVLGAAAIAFIHPRYAAISLLMAGAVATRLYGHPDWRRAAWPSALTAVGGVLAHIAYNLHFSGDLFGPFLPGNAYVTGVLDPLDWPLGMLGQWIDAEVGILTASPFFLFALLGIISLGLKKDRLTYLALLVFALTAGTNALSVNWRFGFCVPSRFMVTAMPVLMLGIAAFLSRIPKRPALWLLFLLSVFVSLDTTITLADLPESAFHPGLLIERAITRFYPVGVHFRKVDQLADLLPDIVLWVGLILSGVLGLSTNGVRSEPPSLGRRFAVLATVTCLPWLTASLSYTDRIASSVSDFTPRFDEDEAKIRAPLFRISSNLVEKTRTPDSAWDLDARAQGLLPYVVPSLWEVTVPAMDIQPRPPALFGGYYVASRRRSLPSNGFHETRYSVPLMGGETVLKGLFTGPRISAQQRIQIGPGEPLEIEDSNVRIRPLEIRETLSLVHRQEEDSKPGAVSLLAMYGKIEPGWYRVAIECEGSTLAAWTDMESPPIRLGLFSSFSNALVATSLLEESARAWLVSPRMAADKVRPSAEAQIDPFWIGWPWGDSERHLDFRIDVQEDVVLGVDYDGPLKLAVTEVSLYRRELVEER